MLKRTAFSLLTLVLLMALGCTLPLESLMSRTTTTAPPSLEEVIAQVSHAVVQLKSSAGSGTGMIISPDGYILTNYHVVEGASYMTVVRESGQQLSGTVTKTDSYNDLALVKINGSGLPTVRLGDSSAVKPGQEVIALGYPLSGNVTVTKGIISAVEAGFIQTDVAINPGNSGGPLINRNGDVVGVVFLKYYGSGYVQAEGIAFAIGANTARSIIPATVQTSQATGNTTPYQAPNTTYLYNTVTKTVPTTIYPPPTTLTVPATTIYTTSTSYAPAITVTTSLPPSVYLTRTATVTATATIPTTVYTTRTVTAPPTTSVPPTTSTPPTGLPDHVIFTYSGIGDMTLPSFTISSNCKLVYTADWSGYFAIHLSGASTVVGRVVTAGHTYETYLNSYTGSRFFTVSQTPASGHWTLTVIENPTLLPPPAGAVFSFSGIGDMTLPTFSMPASGRLVYVANWSGYLAIHLSGASTVVGKNVTAGQTYETYINGYAGSCYFTVSQAPTDGHWTLTVYPA